MIYKIVRSIPFLCLFWSVFCAPTMLYAASIKNLDTKPQKITLAERGTVHSVVLQANQQMDICHKGCFLTLEMGDKFALKGDETLELISGKLNFK